MKLAILNTTIATTDGVYEVETISLKKAKEQIELNKNNLLSAIGHESTAEIMSTLLNTNVEMNRIIFLQEPKQQALVFKLKGRPEEGKILSVEEIEKIGYEFKLMTRVN